MHITLHYSLLVAKIYFMILLQLLMADRKFNVFINQSCAEETRQELSIAQLISILFQTPYLLPSCGFSRVIQLRGKCVNCDEGRFSLDPYLILKPTRREAVFPAQHGHIQGRFFLQAV